MFNCKVSCTIEEYSVFIIWLQSSPPSAALMCVSADVCNFKHYHISWTWKFISACIKFTNLHLFAGARLWATEIYCLYFRDYNFISISHAFSTEFFFFPSFPHRRNVFFSLHPGSRWIDLPNGIKIKLIYGVRSSERGLPVGNRMCATFVFTTFNSTIVLFLSWWA